MASRMFSVQIKGEDKIRRNVQTLRKEFPELLERANIETAEEIRDEARANVKELNAYDTGGLYESIGIRVSPKGLSVTVGATAKQAPYIEFGTAPHFPPLQPIREWCLRKGMSERAAFPIARRIAERGSPERPFLYPAYLVGMRHHINRVRKYLSLGQMLKGA